MEPEHIFVRGLGVRKSLETSQVGQAGKKEGRSGRAENELKRRGLGCWSHGGRKARLKGPGGWCRPSLQGMQEEETEGRRQTVLDGDRGLLSLDRWNLKALVEGLK